MRSLTCGLRGWAGVLGLGLLGGLQGYCAADPPAATLSPQSLAVAASRPATPAEVEQERRLLALAAPGAAIKRTAHFIVAHDVPGEQAGELTARLERTYAAVHRFCELIEIDAPEPAVRLEAIYFNRRADYERYAVRMGFPASDTLGFYDARTHRSVFCNVLNEPQMTAFQTQADALQSSLESLQKELKRTKDPQAMVTLHGTGQAPQRMSVPQARAYVAEQLDSLKQLTARKQAYLDHVNRTVIQHEAAHQMLYDAGVHVRTGDNPPWIVEGLAMMFETPPGGGGAAMAAVNQLRLDEFRLAVTQGDPATSRLRSEQALEAIAAGRLPDLRRLIGDPGLFQDPRRRSGSNYAAAWALTHYLHRTQTQAFADYLADLIQHVDGKHFSKEDGLIVFERHFGPMDEAFTRRWLTYTLNLPARPVRGF